VTTICAMAQSMPIWIRTMYLDMAIPRRKAGNPAHRYSARNMAKPVNFFCAAPEAGEVRLIGDFNDWNPESHCLNRQPDGSWHLAVQLTHGHHHYQFLIDGRPALDPRATGVARDENHGRVSLLAIS
jgi:1,4-alpha-glucan branching enzyme